MAEWLLLTQSSRLRLTFPATIISGRCGFRIPAGCAGGKQQKFICLSEKRAQRGFAAALRVGLVGSGGKRKEEWANCWLPLQYAFVLEMNSNVDQHLTLTALTVNGVNLLPAAAVPEPITLSLFGAGVAGAFAMRRRKAKKA